MSLCAEAREERRLWLRLTLTPGLGPAAVLRLLDAFGPPEEVFAAGRSKLAAVLDAPLAQALLGADAERDTRIDAALAWAEAEHHHLLTLADPTYPPRLLAIGDPPPLLFVHGDATRLAAPALAIVGSRQATRGGSEIAAAFGRALSDEGLLIVSGLAEGIDAAAHRGALAGAAGTVAVVGTGLDLVFPASHGALADAIAARGALVSEQPLGMPALRANFPRRNRIIAGLSLGVLVVEAARQSGSLITARLAGEFGREVMAIPGSIHSPLSKGCHQLIRQGAKLVESADDVLVELRGQFRPARRRTGEAASAATRRPTRSNATAAPRSTQQGLPLQSDPPVTTRHGPSSHAAALPSATAPNAADPADPLLAAIGWHPLDIDGIIARSGAGAAEVAARLVELELSGLVERRSDGRFVRRRTESP